MPFSGFVEVLETIIGVKFVQNFQVEWDLFEAVFMGLFVSVYENDEFRDDGEMEFLKYDLVVDVSSTSSVPGSYRFEWEKLFSIVLANLLKDKGIQYLITDDLQSVIERSA